MVNEAFIWVRDVVEGDIGDDRLPRVAFEVVFRGGEKTIDRGRRSNQGTGGTELLGRARNGNSRSSNSHD